MAKKEWREDDYVSYEEYVPYGVTGEQYDRNSMRSEKLGLSEDETCPLCAKRLKEGSYRTLYCDTMSNGVERYFKHPGPDRTPVKVGTGCVRRLDEAHAEKYGG